MVDKIKEIYIKYKEIINYLIFGAATTAVNFIVYYLFKFIGTEKSYANAIAWVVAVIFAYITNRKYVFESKEKDRKGIIKELVSFVSCRGISGIIDIALFAILVDGLKMNDAIVKIFLQILVIVLNYIFSKLIIFKKKKGEVEK